VDTDPGAGDAPAGVAWMWMADDDGPNGIFADDRTKEKKIDATVSSLYRHSPKLKIIITMPSEETKVSLSTWNTVFIL
jgi:hypothetical protein